MTRQKAQNYENHRVFPRHYVINLIVFLVALILTGCALVVSDASRETKLACVAMLLASFGGISLTAMARSYALTLQDRIIRLEMRYRLAQTLPENLRARITELSVPQLVGLRFASDAELPSLTQRALDERLDTADAIKRLVKDWQADSQRV